jgi:hypothetical protein
VTKALRWVAVWAMLISTSLAGCTSHEYYPFEGRSVPALHGHPLQVFAYRSSPHDVTLGEPNGRGFGYVTRTFSMPASFENGQPGDLVTGTYYDSGLPGKKPLVIVLPVWGVSEYPSTKMTHAILKRSHGKMNVLRVEGDNRIMAWKDIEHSATIEDFVSGVAESAERFRHSIIDVRRLIDWAQTRDEIAGQRIGLVGFSVSAISGTLVVQSDPRVRSSALVMGGADIPTIMSECPGNEADTRRGVIKRLGLTQEIYRQTVAVMFEGLDPTDYPNRVNPASILVVDAAKDDCIPRKAREDWWNALGRPERISMNYTHRGSFMAMTPLGFNFLRKRVYEHLAATL